MRDSEFPESFRKTRIAFCVVPHAGGIYSVYQQLRRTLGLTGWEVFGVQVGNELHRWAFRPELADDGQCAVAGEEANLARAAQQFVEWVVDQQIKIVMPMSSPAAVAAVPHLPPDVRVVNRCISITPHAYGIATSNHAWVDRIVVTSPRQEDDLRRREPRLGTKLTRIPNAVELGRFSLARMPRQGRLRLAFIGRLVEREKGPLLLAEVLRHLRRENVDYQLTIAGSGKDGDRVRESLTTEINAGRVRMRGDCTAEEIAELLLATDLFLLPSKHEGFPNAMLEAMAAGAVPVASRIAGVTDSILRDGESGFLCPINDSRSMASRIAAVARDDALWQEMSRRARDEVAHRFSAERIAGQWDALFREIIALPDRPLAPRPWNSFTVSPAFTRRSPYSWIPARWRNRLRESLEKLRSRRAAS